MNLYRVFARQMIRQPFTAAIVDVKSGRHWSFADIQNASANMASRLAAAGLRQGDGVLLFVPMSGRLYVTLLACFRLGLVVVIIDPSAGREHIERCCRLYPPKAYIATAKAHLLRLAVPALRQIPHQFASSRFVPGALCLPMDTNEGGSTDIAEVSASDAALVSFTSGSTAQPKVAVRSHGFLLQQHRVIKRSQQAGIGNSSLTLFPVFVLSNLAIGITSILADVDLRHPQKINVARLIQAFQAFHPDSLGLQPAVLSRLIEYCQASGGLLEGNFTVYSGGAPVFPALLKRFARVAPGARLVSVYGSTEAEPIAVSEFDCNRADDHVNLTTGLLAGRPVPEIRLQIVRFEEGEAEHEMDRSAFAAKCLGAGAIGEIVVSGKHVLQTYLHGNGDRSNKYKVQGEIWHRTGDAGSIDNKGRLWLAGRCAARIDDTRGSCYPLGIEARVMEVDSVERVAMVLHRAKRILAIECRAKQHTAIADEIREYIDPTEIDELRFFPEIPVDRRHNGKIDYPRLYELLNRSCKGVNDHRRRNEN